MSFGEFTRGPASARLLIGFGQEHGVPAARLLAGTRLAAGQLDDPTWNWPPRRSCASRAICCGC